MVSRISQLADAVAARLSEARLDRPMVVDRNFSTDELKLDDADEIHVDITPIGHDESDLISRGTIGYLARLRIGVRFKFGEADQEGDGRLDPAAVDDMIALVEAIHETIATGQFCGASWVDGSIPFVVVHQHLRDWRQFTAIISERFRIEADLCGEAAP